MSNPGKFESAALKVNSRKNQNNRKFWRSKRPSQNKSLFLGQKFTPSLNPPDITAQPWCNVILAQVDNHQKFFYSDLVKWLKIQVDPEHRGFNRNDFDSNSEDSFRVQFKLRSVTVWNLTGKVLGLSVNDFTTARGGSDQLGGWVDCGGPSSFPAVGYRYPSSHQNFVFRPDQSNKSSELFVTTAGQSDSLLYHISISYRFDGPIKFIVPAQVAEIISSNVCDIKSNQPSILNRIKDGVEVGAAVITAVSTTGDSNALIPSGSINSKESIGDQIKDLVDRFDRLESVLSSVGNKIYQTTNNCEGVVIDNCSSPFHYASDMSNNSDN